MDVLFFKKKKKKKYLKIQGDSRIIAKYHELMDEHDMITRAYQLQDCAKHY